MANNYIKNEKFKGKINKKNIKKLRGLSHFLGKNLLLKIEIWKFPYSCILTNAQIFI